MRTTFFSLSRELRDTIYGYALVFHELIIVYSGPYLKSAKPVAPTSSFSTSLALALFECNRIVSVESTEFFYSKNTFAFLGDHNWDPIISWLESIGRARDHLRSLHITALQPNPCWQNADGTRANMGVPNKVEEPYSRSPYLSPSVCLTGVVENIKPDTETIFLLLGGRRTGKLVISLLLESHTIPGWYLECAHGGGGDDFSMDLPNLIERFRLTHTENGDGGLEVLWVGEALRSQFLEKKSMIQGSGWEIVQMEEREHVFHRTNIPPGVELARKVTTLMMNFILRRREIIGVLRASDPSPYRMTSLEAYRYGLLD
jgi:hypothetical protein